MRTNWLSWAGGILLSTGLVVAGCGEKKEADTVSRAPSQPPYEQPAPPAPDKSNPEAVSPGKSMPEEGAKSPDQIQSGEKQPGKSVP
jgi:hypothetical protein